MYIEGNALILGDSSYLEHHGRNGELDASKIRMALEQLLERLGKIVEF